MTNRQLNSHQKERTGGTATATKQTRRGSQPAPGQVPQYTPAGQKKEPAAPTYDQISERAKVIWQRSGCPKGQDVKNWLEAESELKAEQQVC